MKSMLHFIYRCCLSLLIMGASTMGVSAEGDVGERDRGKRKPLHRDADHVRAFNEADTNQDGYLSSEEFAQMKRLARISPDKRERIFAFLDKNKDGKLHHRELHPAMPPGIAALAKHFAKLDVDGSGGLSLEELKKARLFQNVPMGHVRQLLQRLDRNKNDQLEVNEMRIAEHRPSPKIQFEKYDTDNSGGLSFQEYSAMPFMNRMDEERRKKIFDRLDANNDQQISQDEIKLARSPHRHRGPRNGAGKPHDKPHHKPREPREKRGAMRGDLRAL